MQINIKPTSPWKWVKMVRYIQTKTATEHHVLQVLGAYANLEGCCYPSYEALMRDCCFSSKHTLSRALKGLRKLGVVTWKKGHGNQFRKFANVYTLDQDAMVSLLRDQKKAGTI
jgi:hypothetical protein